MFRFLFIILLVIVSLPGMAQTAPSIHSQRPRIYIDSTRFAYLNANMSIGECGSSFTSWKNAVYNNWYNDPQLYLLGNDSSLWTWDFSSNWGGMQGQFVSALYKITGDTNELKRCRFLAQKINEKFDTLNFSNYDWYTNESTIRGISDVGGMLLDWCYDDFPPALRQHLAQNLYKVSRYFMENYINSSAGTAYVTGHNIWNVYYANQFALVLHDADGLSPEQKDTVLQWYQVSYDKAVNEILPCAGYYRDDDGGWNWTAAYSMWSLVDEFQFFENMRIATGKDFYTELPWVQNSINQYWYFIQPDQWTINWGDGFTKLQGDRVIYLHSRYFNDPRSQWLAQYYSSPQNIGWTWPLYQKLIYKDFTMPVLNKPNPPLDWFSDKTGLSMSRTSWDSSATLVWFYNAPSKKAGHEHRDNNTFTVYKDRPQIINSGYYASYGDAHYVNYYMRSISKNTVCVFDSTEQYTNWGQNVSNDGGQIESPTLMNYNDIFSPQAQRGIWNKQAATDFYWYNNSNAELSYDTSKVEKYRRKTFWLKPDNLIVLDQLQLKQVDTKQRDAKFLLHFQQKPQIDGNIIDTKVPGHIETFDGKDVYQANGNGNVAIRTLLPANSKTTRIGGTDYEFYVNGTNYPVSGGMDTINTTPGNWRIEVSPTQSNDTLTFLHTIKIGDSLNPAMAGGILRHGYYEYCFRSVEWNDVIYFFYNYDESCFGGLVNMSLLNVPGGRNIRAICPDLEPYHCYYLIWGDGEYISLATDENGVFDATHFIPTTSDRFQILDCDVLGISDQKQTDFSMQIIPNPAKDEFSILLNNPSAVSKDLEITNAFGLSMSRAKISDKLQINSRNWPSGIYFVKVTENGFTKTRKLIVTH